jgi:hypothetical protein
MQNIVYDEHGYGCVSVDVAFMSNTMACRDELENDMDISVKDDPRCHPALSCSVKVMTTCC